MPQLVREIMICAIWPKFRRPAYGQAAMPAGLTTTAEILDQVLQTFIDEARELLPVREDAMRDRSAAGRGVQRGKCNISRAAHTIKGFGWCCSPGEHRRFHPRGRDPARRRCGRRPDRQRVQPVSGCCCKDQGATRSTCWPTCRRQTAQRDSDVRLLGSWQFESPGTMAGNCTVPPWPPRWPRGGRQVEKDGGGMVGSDNLSVRCISGRDVLRQTA